MAVSDNEDDRSRSGSPDESGNERPTGNGNMSEVSKDQKPKQNGTSNAKDPSRPRRKKARRACFACQRAHLTCGMSASPSSPSSHLINIFSQVTNVHANDVSNEVCKMPVKTASGKRPNIFMMPPTKLCCLVSRTISTIHPSDHQPFPSVRPLLRHQRLSNRLPSHTFNNPSSLTTSSSLHRCLLLSSTKGA